MSKAKNVPMNAIWEADTLFSEKIRELEESIESDRIQEAICAENIRLNTIKLNHLVSVRRQLFSDEVNE